MKYPLIIGAAMLFGAGCMASAGIGGARDADETLSEVLAGREQGATTPCVDRRNLRGNRSVEDAIVFNGRSSTIYVNRPPAGCPSLEFGRALRTRSPSTRIPWHGWSCPITCIGCFN